MSSYELDGVSLHP